MPALGVSAPPSPSSPRPTVPPAPSPSPRSHCPPPPAHCPPTPRPAAPAPRPHHSGQGAHCDRGRQFAHVRVVPRHGRAAVPHDRLHHRERRIRLPAARHERMPQAVEADLHHGAPAGVHVLLPGHPAWCPDVSRVFSMKTRIIRVLPASPCALPRLTPGLLITSEQGSPFHALLDPDIDGRDDEQREQRRCGQTEDHDDGERTLHVGADALRQEQRQQAENRRQRRQRRRAATPRARRRS